MSIFISIGQAGRADFPRALASVQEFFGRSAVPIHLPIGTERDFKGIIDLIRMKAYMYAPDGDGKGKEGEIPAQYADAEFLGSAGSGHYLLGGSLAHPVRFAVAPDVIGHQIAMSPVDRVADRLADLMIAEHGNGAAEGLADAPHAHARTQHREAFPDRTPETAADTP